MSSNDVKNVAIVGASGHVGQHFVKALLATGKHNITAITRPESKSQIADGVKVIRVSNDDEAGLVSALKGQDFFIITLGVRVPEGTHGKLVAGASKAGVPYLMPNVYGGDTENKEVLSELPYGQGVLKVVQECNESNCSWIAMTCGFWYEWSLAIGEQWFGFDFANKKVTFYDEGKTKINVSTWEQCGRAMAALLSLPVTREGGKGPALEDWKNKPMYIDSFKVCQRDMLDSIHRVTGDTDADWNISYESTAQRVKDGQAELQKGDFRGLAKWMYARNFYPDGNGDYESRKGLDNEKLGLPKDSLDEATKRALDMVNSGWNPFASWS